LSKQHKYLFFAVYIWDYSVDAVEKRVSLLLAHPVDVMCAENKLLISHYEVLFVIYIADFA